MLGVADLSGWVLHCYARHSNPWAVFSDVARQANRCLRTIDNAHTHFITSIDMHRKLPILISGGVDQTIRCWGLD